MHAWTVAHIYAVIENEKKREVQENSPVSKQIPIIHLHLIV